MKRRKRRYQVRGPFAGTGPGKWTVVDTQDRDITVDPCRTKKEATEVAKELNEREDSEDPEGRYEEPYTGGLPEDQG